MSKTAACRTLDKEVKEITFNGEPNSVLYIGITCESCKSTPI